MPSLWLTAERTLNIAHRGASGAAPANTLAAFREAIQQGADAVELDVHLCADGVPVVIHDFSVDHTTDGTGRVADLSLAALHELDAGSWFNATFAGERIPTLDDVLAECGHRLLVNIELKVPASGARGLEAETLSVVERHGMADSVLISSFDPHALDRVRRIAPHIPLGSLYKVFSHTFTGRIRGWRPEAIHPFWVGVVSAAIRRAHARGQRVVAWTVDRPSAMRRLALWKIDGIITNEPGRLRQILEAL